MLLGMAWHGMVYMIFGSWFVCQSNMHNINKQSVEKKK